MTAQERSEAVVLRGQAKRAKQRIALQDDVIAKGKDLLDILKTDAVKQKRELRNLKKNLKALTDNVLRHLVWLDEEMKKPESLSRGKRLAQISNALDIANDAARYHGLGVDFRKDNKDRERARVMRAA